jgi:hypothetical protein
MVQSALAYAKDFCKLAKGSKSFCYDPEGVMFQYIMGQGNKFTFLMPSMNELIRCELAKHTKVLVPFAGYTRFTDYPNITYIDINPNLPQPLIVGDARFIVPALARKGEKYDLIISDPPWTDYQALHTYGLKKMQDISWMKKWYDRMLLPGGHILWFAYTSTGYGEEARYIKESIYLVNVGASMKDFIVIKERKVKDAEEFYDNPADGPLYTDKDRQILEQYAAEQGGKKTIQQVLM